MSLKYENKKEYFNKKLLLKKESSKLKDCCFALTPCCAVFSHSVVSDSAISWTVARQTPQSMGILQAKILEWVAMPPPGDLPNPGIKLKSPILQMDSLPSDPPVIFFHNKLII